MTIRAIPVLADVPADPTAVLAGVLLVEGGVELPCPVACAVVPAEAAGIPVHYDPAPLLTWLRLRLGLRRCLACGRLGNRSLQPAHPLVPPAKAQTWACTDRVACGERRHRRDLAVGVCQYRLCCRVLQALPQLGRVHAELMNGAARAAVTAVLRPVVSTTGDGADPRQRVLRPVPGPTAKAGQPGRTLAAIPATEVPLAMSTDQPTVPDPTEQPCSCAEEVAGR